MKKIAKYLFLFVLLLCSGHLASAQVVRFIQNKGQWQDAILFKADIPGGSLFITRNGLVYNLVDEGALHQQQHNKANSPVKGHALFADWVEPSPAMEAVGYSQVVTKYNYYLGNDTRKWATGVPAFERIVIRNVFPYIDFEIAGADGGVKTAFIVRQGGVPSRIRVRYRGADAIQLNNNDLHISHSLGMIKELKPETYLTNRGIELPVPSAYRLNGDTLSYQVINPKGLSLHDSLIIDPSIVFSTFSGSVADNFGFTATHDNNGNAYGGGTVFSAGFPVTAGAYQLTFLGGVDWDGTGSRDAGILKFSPDGTTLLYATYLGGNGNEQPHSMSCSANGNLYIMGTTSSSNFPVQSGFDMSHNGGYDVFVACLSADGTTLVAGTYLGSTGEDGINAHVSNDKSNQLQYNYGDEFRGDVRLDENGNVYIATVTQSSFGLPLRMAHQSAYGGGGQDGWVMKLNPQLNNLIYSSYIGGSGEDAAYGLRIAGSQFYVTGGTNSGDLPRQVTDGVFSYHGGIDGFLACYTQTGITINHTKTLYIGTDRYDQGYFVSTDDQGRIYVTGQTAGTFGSIGNVYHENGGHQFITVINSSLNAIVLQSAFGSGGNFPKLSPSAFQVDRCNRVYLSGWGGGTNRSHNPFTGMVSGLYISADAFQRTTDGSDFYLIIFNKDLKSVAYATYFGGNLSQEHVDGGTSQFDEQGVVYQSVCAGCGGLSDFPTTAGAHSRINQGKRAFDPSQGGCNNAVFKFNAKPTPSAPAMRDTTIYLYASDTVNYQFDVLDANLDSIFITGLEGRIFTFPPPGTPDLQVVRNQPGLLTLQLKWISACANANDTLQLKLKFGEAGCDANLTSSGTITIIVRPMPEPMVDLACITRSGPSDAVLSWSNVAQGPFARYIDRVVVFRSADGGSYTPLVTLTGSEISQNYTDKNLTDINSINYCYRAITINRCGKYSTYSREACILALDSINPNAYQFARDTIYYVIAMDTLNTTFLFKDKVFTDSMFVAYHGSLRQSPYSTISSFNGAGEAGIGIYFTPPCELIGDTLLLGFSVQDNTCPRPVKDKGQLKVVVLPSPPAQSVPLNCLKKKTANTVSLTWKEPTNSKYLKRFELLRLVDGNWTNQGALAINPEKEVIQVVTDPEKKATCFALVAYNYCEIPSDTGALSCVPWPDSMYPKSILPHYVTVADNRQIELSWHNDSLPIMEIFRYDEASGVRTLLNTITNDVTDTIWTDQQVNVQKQRYCYAVEPTSSCGLKPKDTAYACSMLLKGKSVPFEHALSWTEYSYFAEGTNRHELWTRDLTDESFEKILTAPVKVQVHTDVNLNKETGVFYYYIEATENSPGTYTSRSNTVELKQAPLLHIPNAFTPNEDALNEKWNVVPVFVNEYHMRIYDRWGRLVFETHNKHEQFTDKDMSGDLLPADVYAYVVTFTGFEGTVKQRTGNVTILK